MTCVSLYFCCNSIRSEFLSELLFKWHLPLFLGLAVGLRQLKKLKQKQERKQPTFHILPNGSSQSHETTKAQNNHKKSITIVSLESFLSVHHVVPHAFGRLAIVRPPLHVFGSQSHSGKAGRARGEANL